MTNGDPTINPYDTGTEPKVIANFVDDDGELIDRWSATNLPIPSIGETVSFGELHAPSTEALDTEKAEYHLNDELYEVIEVEYSYSEIKTEDEEPPQNSEFVIVTIYVVEADSQ